MSPHHPLHAPHPPSHPAFAFLTPLVGCSGMRVSRRLDSARLWFGTLMGLGCWTFLPLLSLITISLTCPDADPTACLPSLWSLSSSWSSSGDGGSLSSLLQTILTTFGSTFGLAYFTLGGYVYLNWQELIRS